VKTTLELSVRKPVCRAVAGALLGTVPALLAAGVASAQVQIAADTRTLVARADSAYGAGDRDGASELYRSAAELDPTGSRSWYQLGVLERDPAKATRWFLRYLALEPKDAWGWLALGKSYGKQEKWREATKALRHAAALAPNASEIREALAKARRKSAPALRSQGGYSRDSDGNRVASYGLAGDATLPAGLRIGATATRSSVGDGGRYAAAVDEGQFRVGGRVWPSLRFDLSGGATGSPIRRRRHESSAPGRSDSGGGKRPTDPRSSSAPIAAR
jgi:tetratricopeptide (TPR) repeat protein